MPFLKLRLQLGAAELGLILLGFGGGALLAMPFHGALIQRYGSRRVIGAAGLLIAAALALLGVVASALAAAPVVLLLGAAFGALDVAMNTQAVTLEARGGRPMMASFHALYSAGGLAGSAGISLLLRLGLPAAGCAGTGAGLIAAVLLLQYRHLLPPAQGLPAAGGRGTGGKRGAAFSLPRGRAALLGVMCLASFLAEGAVLDWAAVLLRFNRDVPAAWAGLGYAGFSVAMAGGRLFGDRLTRRAGPGRMVLAGGVVSGLGFLAAVAVPSGAASIAGFVLIGAGAANIVPVLLSAAARLPGQPAAHTLAAVSTLGYAGLLAGPAAIGALAQATSLPLALGAVGLLMLAVAAAAPAVARQ